jgi:hypothetical protein
MYQRPRVLRTPGGVARTAAAAVAVAGMLVAGMLAGGAQAPGARAAAPAVAGHGAISVGPSAGGRDAPAAPPPIDINAYNTCAHLQYPTLYPGDAYVAGYSNAKKLGGAAVVGVPALGVVRGEPPGEGWASTDATEPGGAKIHCNAFFGQLYYQGQRAFPPARATFMAFGFMPVTATVTITQVGQQPVRAYASTTCPDGCPWSVVSLATVSVSISNVTVNGVPLDVGSNCHTTGPLTSPDSPVFDRNNPQLVLVGGTVPGDPQPWNKLQNGGSLAGTATIPPFTGCVTPGGDNLDALLTASVSGPGNYVYVNQSVLCSPPNNGLPFNCEPDGTPNNVPLWTVKHGGTYTGTGTFTFTWDPNHTSLRFGTVTCSSSRIAGIFTTDASGPPRGDLASVTGIGGSSCAGSFRDAFGSTTSTWTVAQQGTAFFDGVYYDAATGTTTGTLSDLAFNLTETSGPQQGCTVEFRAGHNATNGVPNPDTPGAGDATYTNPPSSTLSILPSSTYSLNLEQYSETAPPGHSCPRTITIGDPTNRVASYHISPSTVTITSPSPPG